MLQKPEPLGRRWREISTGCFLSPRSLAIKTEWLPQSGAGIPEGRLRSGSGRSTRLTLVVGHRAAWLAAVSLV